MKPNWTNIDSLAQKALTLQFYEGSLLSKVISFIIYSIFWYGKKCCFFFRAAFLIYLLW